MNPQQPAAATQQPNNMDPQQQQLYQQQQQQQQQQQWMWAQQQQYQAQQQQPQQAQQQQAQQQAQQQQIWAQQQQYQQAQQQQQVGNGGGGDEVRTLWIGDLQYWMDESYISNCFANSEIVTVKVIRNKVTLQSEGYGFVDFSSHAAAERVLQTYNGALMPNVEQTFRLNWASHGSGEKRSDDGSDYTIFVGDLAPDVTDYTLQEAFKAHYPSVKGAKVVMDKLTGRAKGYGFVRFGDENEQLRAMSEMNGVMCSGRAMRIGVASKKTAVGAASYQNTQATQNDSDPNNTTLFVGNLDSSVTDEHLRQTFSQYGEVVHVKIPVGKQCGFVQFTSRSSAEEALSAMNGAQLGGRTIRISWGHNTSNRRPQAEQNQNQWNNTPYYGYPQGQDPYGYAAPQNPNMYYGGYPGYGGYAVPQQAQQPAQQQQ